MSLERISFGLIQEAGHSGPVGEHQQELRRGPPIQLLFAGQKLLARTAFKEIIHAPGVHLHQGGAAAGPAVQQGQGRRAAQAQRHIGRAAVIQGVAQGDAHVSVEQICHLQRPLAVHRPGTVAVDQGHVHLRVLRLCRGDHAVQRGDGGPLRRLGRQIVLGPGDNPQPGEDLRPGGGDGHDGGDEQQQTGCRCHAHLPPGEADPLPAFCGLPGDLFIQRCLDGLSVQERQVQRSMIEFAFLHALTSQIPHPHRPPSDTAEWPFGLGTAGS